jgi:hypothetical protein
MALTMTLSCRRRKARVRPRWTATIRNARPFRAASIMHRAARLETWQVEPPDALHPDLGVKEHRVPVPAEADVVAERSTGTSP